MSDAADVISSIGGEVPIGDLRDSLAETLDELEARYRPLTDRVDGYRYSITMALHGALLLLLLLLGAAAAFNHHAGLSAAAALALLLLIVTFIAAVVHAGALFVVYQGCPIIYPWMADALGGGALADYYIYGKGASSAGNMLEKEGFVDPKDVRARARPAGRGREGRTPRRQRRIWGGQGAAAAAIERLAAAAGDARRCARRR